MSRRAGRRIAHGLCTLALVAACPTAAASADTCPEWLRQAAARALTSSQRESPAVVLLDQEVTTVSSDGAVRTHRLYAAKILNVQGRDAASLRQTYLTQSDKVREIRGWVIRPSGTVEELGKESVIDVALVNNDVYNDVRSRVVTLGPNPEPGAVFGGEVVTESQSIFRQFDWALQEEWPVAQVVRTLVLPPGWKVSARTFNHPSVEPRLQDRSWTWEVFDLPRIADEPFSLPSASLAPRLAVGYEPPPGERSDQPIFSDWQAVSRWLASVTDAAAAPDPAVITRAKSLVGGAATEVDRLRALAAFVQRIPYVSIQIGTGRGGGYRPHPSAEVMAKGHGDCKDKASLLRALLAAVGQQAYVVSVFAGDPTYVREEWPSPHQFNHVILGIVTKDLPKQPATVDVPGVGRLLLFDPTDPYTPLGELPLADQAGVGLLVSSAGGPLLRLPDAGDRGDAKERTLEAEVGGTGGLNLRLKERAVGLAAAIARERHRGLAPEEYQRTTAERLGVEIARSRVENLVASDTEDAFDLSASLVVPSYAQVVQGRLLLIRCPSRLTEGLPALGTSARRTPVFLEPQRRVETFVLSAAVGLQVDELPESLSGVSPFGSYRVSARREGEKVVIEREITIRRLVVPQTDFEALQAFLVQARRVDAATVVFVKK